VVGMPWIMNLDHLELRLMFVYDTLSALRAASISCLQAKVLSVGVMSLDSRSRLLLVVFQTVRNLQSGSWILEFMFCQSSVGVMRGSLYVSITIFLLILVNFGLKRGSVLAVCLFLFSTSLNFELGPSLTASA
jgi:hypothetical protein